MTHAHHIQASPPIRETNRIVINARKSNATDFIAKYGLFIAGLVLGLLGGFFLIGPCL